MNEVLDPAGAARRGGAPVPVAVAAAVLAAAGAVAAFAAGRSANPGPIGFPLDDAWIHMVYGRGLLANGFLAYEDGVPSTGCTSPAWSVVLAVGHALFARGDSASPVVAAVMAIGALLHIAGAVAAAGLARRCGAGDTAALVAGGIVGIAPPLATASLSGMEVALTAWLLVCGTSAAAARRAGAAGIWFAAAGWARPESAVVLAVVAAFAIPRAPATRRAGTAARILGPALLAGAALVAYDVWASGRPLPATFYAKSAASLPDLPRRLAVAAGAILDRVPPFGFGLGWFAAIGAALAVARRHIVPGSAPVALLPLVAGITFVVANVAVLDPVDPAAFYHRRYLLPALPLLVAAAAVGAHAWGRLLPAAAARLPVFALGAAALVQTAVTLGPESRHHHNDVRNINEVQRAVGERLGAVFAPGTRIAASDAGAVRYFSRLPVVDVLGLNTPAMLAPDDAWLRAHPVAALAFLPAWFRTPDGARLEEMFRAETADYTVTSNPRMGVMTVVRAREDAAPVRARFGGFRPFALEFASPEAARSATVRAAP